MLRFSIVIPTQERLAALTECLESISLLEYPREAFEVIVVNDGGREPLDAVADAFGGRLDLTWIEQSRAGPAAARNTGARKARGQFLAFTDDDCVLDAGWLGALEKQLTEAEDRIVGGSTRNALPGNPFSTTSQLILDAVYAYWNRDPLNARFFTTNNMAVPTSPFLSLQGFDEAFLTSEDREFCDRWRLLGGRLSYVHDAVVQHARQLGFAGFWRQHFHYGRGALRFHRLRAQRSGEVNAPEQAAFLLHLLRYPFSRRCGQPRALIAALVVISQAASSCGFLWEALRGLLCRGRQREL